MLAIALLTLLWVCCWSHASARPVRRLLTSTMTTLTV